MTFDEVEEQALKLVERRGETTLPIKQMSRQKLQQLCGTHRWYWRKGSLTFTTVSGTATYDLSSITTVPANAGKDFEEAIDLFYVASATDVRPLSPIFGEEAYADAAADTTTDTPSGYFLDRNASQTLRIYKVPGGAYSIRVTFWRIPYFSSDDSTPAIPLLPLRMHPILVYGLAADLAAFNYGIQDARSGAFEAKYQQMLQEEMRKDSGSVHKIREFRDMSSAVRSTRG